MNGLDKHIGYRPMLLSQFKNDKKGNQVGVFPTSNKTYECQEWVTR